MIVFYYYLQCLYEAPMQLPFITAALELYESNSVNQYVNGSIKNPGLRFLESIGIRS